MDKILGVIKWIAETLRIPLEMIGEWLKEHEEWLGRWYMIDRETALQMTICVPVFGLTL